MKVAISQHCINQDNTSTFSYSQTGGQKALIQAWSKEVEEAISVDTHSPSWTQLPLGGGEEFNDAFNRSFKEKSSNHATQLNNTIVTTSTTPNSFCKGSWCH
jgi:hypothetical protein